MFREQVQNASMRRGRSMRSTGISFWLVLALVATYGGYFGAAAGVILLAWLMLTSEESLAYSAAEKNVLLGAANLSATVGFVFISQIHWPAAICVAGGGVVGAFVGPKVLRKVPERPMRLLIGLLGLGLAVKLLLDAL